MKKIYFVLKVPPPIHGSTVMNKIVLDSAQIKNAFDCQYLKLSYSDSVGDIGKGYGKKILKLIVYFFELKKSLKLISPDLIYFAISPSGVAFFKDALLVYTIKKQRIPIVFHLHGKGIRNFSSKSYFHAIVVKWVFRGENAICLSPTLTSDIEGIVEKKPYIIPNGIVNEKNNKLAIEGESNIPHFIFLSNFIKSKGVLLFVEALKILHDKGIDFVYSLIGNSGDINNSDLLKMTDDLGIRKKLNHIGPKYGHEKIEALQSANIFVFPTFYNQECFPLVILEAMQCGLPIISTNEGGISDIIEDGQTGFIVERKSLKLLASKMEILANNVELRKTMGDKAKVAYTVEYTIEKFEKNIIRVLNSILTKK